MLVLRLKRILLPTLLSGVVLGVSLAASISVAGAGDVEPDDGSTTTVVTSTDSEDSSGQAAAPIERRSTNDTIQLVTRSLIGIAVLVAVMLVVFFWYTMPSRRLRLSENSRSVDRSPGD